MHVAQTAASVTLTAVGTPIGDGPCPLRLLVGTGQVLLDAPLDGGAVIAPALANADAPSASGLASNGTSQTGVGNGGGPDVQTGLPAHQPCCAASSATQDAPMKATTTASVVTTRAASRPGRQPDSRTRTTQQGLTPGGALPAPRAVLRRCPGVCGASTQLADLRTPAHPAGAHTR